MYVLYGVLKESVVGVRRDHQAIAVVLLGVKYAVDLPPANHADKNGEVEDVSHPQFKGPLGELSVYESQYDL